MDKENRNFDAETATRDRYGNITAKNQHGIDATGEPRKPDDMLVTRRGEKTA